MNVKNKHRAIAIDFDGTITQASTYPMISPIRPYAAEVINALQENGYYCYLWTCRHGTSLTNAIQWLKSNGIELDGYNSGPCTGSPKLVADVYIDDAAYPNNGTIDWLEIAKYFGISI